MNNKVRKKINTAESWRTHTQMLFSEEWRWKAALIAETLACANAFFLKNDIRPWAVPISTGAISSPMGLGSDSLPVSVDLYGRRTFLADSMQFALELGLRMAESDVYYIATSFRGEEADRYHLREFHHIEAEISGDLNGVMVLASELALTITRHLIDTPLWDRVPDQDKLLRFAKLSTTEIPTVAHRDAIGLLKSHRGALRTIENVGEVITRLGEQVLCDRFDGVVWLTQLPWKACPFYQRESPGAPGEAEAADLLMGGVEVIGAGARCVTARETLRSLSAHETPSDEYGWYLEMKRAEPIQTAGFGMGLERFVMWLIDEEHIQNCTPWVRNSDSAFFP